MDQDWTKEKRMAARMFAIAAGSAALYFVALAATSVQSAAYIGKEIPPQATISVSGEGKSVATPDIAEISFGVVSEKATVAEAQTEVATKLNAIRAALALLKVNTKDIQNQGYNVYPRYEYESKPSAAVVCDARSVCPPPPVNSERVLKGYEASQSVVVKVRNIADAGKVVDALGAAGATNVGGINLVVDKPEMAQNAARAEAIAKAKQQADVLARQLGVRLVRVLSFNENGGGYPMPYAKSMAMDSGMGESAPSSDIPVGESSVVSNVSITYEVR